MRRPRRPGALRIALVAPLVLAGLARDAAATGEKLPWGEWGGESCSEERRKTTCRWLSRFERATTTTTGPWLSHGPRSALGARASLRQRIWHAHVQLVECAAATLPRARCPAKRAALSSTPTRRRRRAHVQRV